MLNKSIFISYAWEQDEPLDKKVKNFSQWLAIYLQSWGFRVHLDVLENHPGTQLDEFMKNGIDSSHFVICICTQTYLKKISDSATGVYNEIELIKKQAKSPFIIAIIDIESFTDLPDFFKGKYISQLKFDTPFSQENKKGLFELISTIRDELFLNIKVETKPDAQDRIESYYNSVEKIKFFNDSANLMNFKPQSEGEITFQYLLNGGDFKLGISPMEFITHWTSAGSDTIYSYKKVNKMMRIHNFENFDRINKPADIDFDKVVDINWAASLREGDGIVWINEKNYLAIGKIIQIYLDSEDEYKSMVTLAYKILNPIDLTDDFIDSK
ncbi:MULTISPECIES: toll/interleukin-1 receptor domain-containing protein [Lactococcus]|uniref:toll/interleukin-1 receptor domain-containing protein n=1 Tax=Lactococcus TaxID=1357 RepID=UPI001C27788F|nr:toll/interleukin-1 receptor domain-containing protein [Lactococcus cremoris]MBU8904763.1 toll/interleukin-1 receptor domain-containing protein [Lactococcus cremoris]